MVAYEAGVLVNVDVPYPGARAASAPSRSSPNRTNPARRLARGHARAPRGVRAAGLYEQAALDGWHNLDGWLAIPGATRRAPSRRYSAATRAQRAT